MLQRSLVWQAAESWRLPLCMADRIRDQQAIAAGVMELTWLIYRGRDSTLPQYVFPLPERLSIGFVYLAAGCQNSHSTFWSGCCCCCCIFMLHSINCGQLAADTVLSFAAFHEQWIPSALHTR